MTKKNKLTEQTEKRVVSLMNFVRETIVPKDDQSRIYQEKVFEIDEEDHFHLIQRNKGTEAIIKSGNSQTNGQLQKSGSTDVYLDFSDIRLIIDNFLTEPDSLKFSTLLSKLFTIILVGINQGLDASNPDDNSIDLDLKYIAERIGKNIEKANKKSEFKKDINNTLELLRKMTIRIYSERLKGKEMSDEITTASILRSYTVRTKGAYKDVITVNLAEEFLTYLRLGYWMPFGKSLLKITDSGSYQFHNELNNYTSIPNNFIPRHNTKAVDVQAKIFSIHTAIKWCKSIPGVEDVKNSDRQYERRIIQRLESIFEEEHGLIKKWEWCKAKGIALTEDEHIHLTEYDIINQLFIHIIELKNEEEYLENILPATGRIIESDQRKAKVKARRLNIAKKVQPHHIDK